MHVTERKGHESSKDFAIRVIRENIISLELEPGTSVSANELTNKMDIYSLLKNFDIHFDRVRSVVISAVKELKIVEDHKKRFWKRLKVEMKSWQFRQ